LAVPTDNGAKGGLRPMETEIEVEKKKKAWTEKKLAANRTVRRVKN